MRFIHPLLVPHRAFAGATIARGAVELVALHRGAACRRGEGGEYAAQRIGEEEVGRAALQLADEPPIL